jgi:predicted phosphodiesterase
MILFLGDIHGNFNYIAGEIKRKKITNCTIIQVGDFGIGFTTPENDLKILEAFNLFLKDHGVIMYAIRGNHDNPKFFQGDYIFDNLKLITDYTVLEIEDHKILCVGGAVSIDRVPRLNEMQKAARYGSKKEQFWFDEKFVFEEDKVKDLKEVDIVVTHTAPEWCVPDNRNGFGAFVEGFAYYDNKLLEDLAFERAEVTKMFKLLNQNNNIKYHFYGHFHRHDITINGYTTHMLLDINEFWMLDE